MLFDPARHEALQGLPWDEGRAVAAMQAIAADAVQARLREGHWPVHPSDVDGDTPRGGFKSLYLGSAGVLWALAYLQSEGAIPAQIDAADGIEHALATYRADPDTGRVVPSYFLGEVGLQLVRWRLGASATAEQALFDAVAANIDNPTNEALWAAPGTMVAAWHLWQATAQERWRRLFLDNVEQVWRTWLFDEKAGCHLWTQDLYGQVVQYLGAGHGFAGNAYALLKGAALLDTPRREELYRRCEETAQRLATVEDGAANWPPATAAPRPGRPAFLMQWCHGAPGFVTALADFPPGRSAAFDALLLGAGEAVWRAGPLEKGPGICHGTAGNGYAFLKLFRRTGDTTWLERARAFGMHAVAQCERQRARHGHGRYTLWTGDAGLAVYLWHCRTGTADLPALDAV